LTLKKIDKQYISRVNGVEDGGSFSEEERNVCHISVSNAKLPKIV
jgi:hypothetical protein